MAFHFGYNHSVFIFFIDILLYFLPLKYQQKILNTEVAGVLVSVYHFYAVMQMDFFTVYGKHELHLCHIQSSVSALPLVMVLQLVVYNLSS